MLGKIGIKGLGQEWRKEINMFLLTGCVLGFRNWHKELLATLDMCSCRMFSVDAMYKMRWRKKEENSNLCQSIKISSTYYVSLFFLQNEQNAGFNSGNLLR